MKKLLVLMGLMALGVNSAFAQQGEMAVGAHVDISAAMGIGAKFQYGITDAIRIEPSANYYFGNIGNLFDFSANVNYLFDVSERAKVYPLAGVGFGINKDFILDESTYEDCGRFETSGGLVVNLGGGAEYALNDKFSLGADLKYQIVTGGFSHITFGAGVIYKF
ncbi:outer membrane beta-barrel protein [Parabacteroides sp.]